MTNQLPKTITAMKVLTYKTDWITSTLNLQDPTIETIISAIIDDLKNIEITAENIDFFDQDGLQIYYDKTIVDDSSKQEEEQTDAVQHPIYPWLSTEVSDVTYPDYDGTQNCAQVGVEVFFYSADEEDEPYVERGRNIPSVMKKFKLPYKTYSYHDALLVDVCHDCPFLQQCFAHSLVNEEYGFWAGTNAGDRNRLRKQHNIKLHSNDFNVFSDADARRIARAMQLEQEDNDGVG